MMDRTKRTAGILLSLLLLATIGYGQRPSVEAVRFKSKLIQATLPYNVILPAGYQESRVTRYPVLYLLHGLAGHYSDWLTRTNVADYASQYGMIVVMPEGNNGWYTDGGGTTADKYESYILQELMPDVDQRYRTIQSRHGRAVAGLSMGGFGALKFALKYPDRFVFAGSMSGALGAAIWTEDDLKNLAAIKDSIFSVFGPVGSETRKKNNIFEMVRSMSPARIATLPYLYLDCGTEDILILLNQEFAVALREKKVPHEFRELPGNHNWAYWDQQVQEVLRIAARHVRQPRRADSVKTRPTKTR